CARCTVAAPTSERTWTCEPGRQAVVGDVDPLPVHQLVDAGASVRGGEPDHGAPREAGLPYQPVQFGAAEYGPVQRAAPQHDLVAHGHSLRRDSSNQTLVRPSACRAVPHWVAVVCTNHSPKPPSLSVSGGRGTGNRSSPSGWPSSMTRTCTRSDRVTRVTVTSPPDRPEAVWRIALLNSSLASSSMFSRRPAGRAAVSTARRLRISVACSGRPGRVTERPSTVVSSTIGARSCGLVVRRGRSTVTGPPPRAVRPGGPGRPGAGAGG